MANAIVTAKDRGGERCRSGWFAKGIRTVGQWIASARPADTSATGMKQSAGLMANYVYDVADLERNHELYARSGKVVCSRRVQTQAKQAAPANHSN